MAASEAAVTAVMETLGCDRVTRTNERHPAPWTGCAEHFQTWTHRGCPVAVAAADAAVDADRASIQAETLREAAKTVRARVTASNANIGPNGRFLERRAIADMLSAKAGEVMGCADRIEVHDSCPSP